MPKKWINKIDLVSLEQKMRKVIEVQLLPLTKTNK